MRCTTAKTGKRKLAWQAELIAREARRTLVSRTLVAPKTGAFAFACLGPLIGSLATQTSDLLYNIHPPSDASRNRKPCLASLRSAGWLTGKLAWRLGAKRVTQSINWPFAATWRQSLDRIGIQRAQRPSPSRSSSSLSSSQSRAPSCFDPSHRLTSPTPPRSRGSASATRSCSASTGCASSATPDSSWPTRTSAKTSH